MKRAALALVAGAILLVTGAAHADDPRDVARQRYAEGVQLYRNRSFAEALKAFDDAYDATPNFRVLYNVAQVQAQLRDYASSIATFERYLRDGGAEVDAAREAEVRAEIGRMNALLGTIEVTCSTPGAHVFLDDVDVGSAPQSLRVNVGPRTVRVSADGYLPTSERILLSPGERKRIELTLRRAPTVAAAPPQIILRDRAPTPAGWITARWALGIGTAALAVGTVTTGAMAIGRNGALDDALAKQPADPARIATLRSQLRTMNVASDVFFIAGGVSLAGLIVALVGPFRHAPKKSAWSLSPTLGGATLEVLYR